MTVVTNRQRILTALAHRNTPGDLPFLPWGLDAYAQPPHPSYAPLFDLLRTQAVIKRRWVVSPDFFTPAAPVECITQQTVTSDGTILENVRLAGPGGELTCERRGIPGTTAREATHRFITSAEEAELYLSWPYEDQPVDVAPFFALDREVGTQGVVTCRLSTALGIIGENFEPEPLALCSVESSDMIMALLSVIAERVFLYIQDVLEAGARPIVILSGPEFATPPLLSPRNFDDYVVRFDRPLIEMIHSYGCPVIVHCHGRLNAVLERFVDMGVDGLHPLETPPMGDVTLAEAKRRVGERLCFVGNVQIGDMMSAEPAEITRQVREIRRLSPSGMILSTSATPYEAPMSQRLFENYAAACAAANE